MAHVTKRITLQHNKSSCDQHEGLQERNRKAHAAMRNGQGNKTRNKSTCGKEAGLHKQKEKHLRPRGRTQKEKHLRPITHPLPTSPSASISPAVPPHSRRRPISPLSPPSPFPSMVPSPPLSNLGWRIDSQHDRTYVPSNWGIDEGMM